MKRFLSLIIIALSFITLGGCGNSAKDAVAEYLSKYQNLDQEVLSDMNEIVIKENLNDTNTELYKDIFIKQYSDLTYTIESEKYAGDEATVTVVVKVYDLYKAQKLSAEYLASHTEEFNDYNNKYDVNKYINYKLNQMKETTDTVEYSIDFYLIKTSDKWIVSELSAADLSKIHGIYNYES